MKKYIALAILFITSLGFSQTVKYTGNAQELFPYVGTWRWTSGNQTFEFTFNSPLQETDTWNNITTHYTSIRGFHKYIVNNVIIENPQNTSRVLTILSFGEDENKGLSIFYYDISKNKSGDAFLKFLPNSTTQAVWTLNESEGIKEIPIGTVYPLGWSVPTGPITMTKVN